MKALAYRLVWLSFISIAARRDDKCSWPSAETLVLRDNKFHFIKSISDGPLFAGMQCRVELFGVDDVTPDLIPYTDIFKYKNIKDVTVKNINDIGETFALSDSMFIASSYKEKRLQLIRFLNISRRVKLMSAGDKLVFSVICFKKSLVLKPIVRPSSDSAEIEGAFGLNGKPPFCSKMMERYLCSGNGDCFKKIRIIINQVRLDSSFQYDVNHYPWDIIVKYWDVVEPTPASAIQAELQKVAAYIKNVGGMSYHQIDVLNNMATGLKDELGYLIFPTRKKIRAIEASINPYADNIISSTGLYQFSSSTIGQHVSEGAAKRYQDDFNMLLNADNVEIQNELENIAVTDIEHVCYGENIYTNAPLPLISLLSYNEVGHKAFLGKFFYDNPDGFVTGKTTSNLLKFYIRGERPRLKLNPVYVVRKNNRVSCPTGYYQDGNLITLGRHWGEYKCVYKLDCYKVKNLDVICDYDATYLGRSKNWATGVEQVSSLVCLQTAMTNLIDIPELAFMIASFGNDDSLQLSIPHFISSGLLMDIRRTCICPIEGPNGVHYNICPRWVFDSKAAQLWLGRWSASSIRPSNICTYKRDDNVKHQNHECEPISIDKKVNVLLIILDIVTLYKRRLKVYASMRYLLESLPKILAITSGRRQQMLEKKNLVEEICDVIEHKLEFQGLAAINIQSNFFKGIYTEVVDYCYKIYDDDSDESQDSFHHTPFIEQLYAKINNARLQYGLSVDHRDIIFAAISKTEDKLHYLNLLDCIDYINFEGIDMTGENEVMEKVKDIVSFAPLEDEEAGLQIKRMLSLLSDIAKLIKPRAKSEEFLFQKGPNLLTTLSLDGKPIEINGIPDPLHAVMLRCIIGTIGNIIVHLHEIVDVTHTVQGPSLKASFKAYVKKCSGLDVGPSRNCNSQRRLCFDELKSAHGALGLNYLHICDWGKHLGVVSTTQRAVRVLQSLCKFINEILVFSYEPEKEFEFLSRISMKKFVSAALNGIEDIVHYIHPVIHIDNFNRGNDIPYVPTGTRSCHYMFVHIPERFYQYGSTGKHTTSMPEWVQGQRRRVEKNVNKGRNSAHSLNRHGKALRILSNMKIFYLQSTKHIRKRKKEAADRRKRFLTKGRMVKGSFVPGRFKESKRLAKEALASLRNLLRELNDNYVSPVQMFYRSTSAEDIEVGDDRLSNVEYHQEIQTEDLPPESEAPASEQSHASIHIDRFLRDEPMNEMLGV
jgi:hypothetical protein